MGPRVTRRKPRDERWRVKRAAENPAGLRSVLVSRRAALSAITPPYSRQACIPKSGGQHEQQPGNLRRAGHAGDAV